jgi:hypothetical protein
MIVIDDQSKYQALSGLSLCLKLFEGFQERWKFRQAW